MITQNLSGHTESRATGQQSVLRVLFELFGGYLGILTVGGAGNNQACHCLHVPFTVYKFGSKPIEQVWVGGEFGLGAHIVSCAANACAKIALPCPIHPNPGCERVAGAGKPPCQREAVGFAAGRGRGQHGRKACRDLIAFFVVLAADEYMGFARRTFFHHHGCWQIVFQTFERLLSHGQLFLSLP